MNTKLNKSERQHTKSIWQKGSPFFNLDYRSDFVKAVIDDIARTNYARSSYITTTGNIRKELIP